MIHRLPFLGGARPALRLGQSILAAVSAFILGAALGGLAMGQTPAPFEDEVHDIAKQMNCPTCAGRNLADCPTETCAQWKKEIGAQLQAGKSRQEVLDYFEARFGPTVMQEPPKEGATLALWVVPVLGALGLAAAGIMAVRRASGRNAALASPGAPAPQDARSEVVEAADAYVAKLEEQVRE